MRPAKTVEIIWQENLKTDGFKYWAFITYSHRDKQWGDWLHRSLETYRVPKRLVGQPNRDGVRPRRLFPVFRDREELQVSADLSSRVHEALAKSRYLVVICSPNSAKSLWVNQEIKFFKSLGREDRVLTLIVSGEPHASDHSKECFPEALVYQVSLDGSLLPARSEPIAGDAREGKDGKLNAKLKLLAGLLDVNFAPATPIGNITCLFLMRIQAIFTEHKKISVTPSQNIKPHSTLFKNSRGEILVTTIGNMH